MNSYQKGLEEQALRTAEMIESGEITKEEYLKQVAVSRAKAKASQGRRFTVADAESTDPRYNALLAEGLVGKAGLYVDEKALPADALLTDTALEAIPPQKWYLRHLLPEDGLAVLYGPPKVGKTFLTLDWAYRLANNQAWLDYTTVGYPLKVLYLAAEGLGSIGQRTTALRQKREFSGGNPNIRFMTGSRDLYNPSSDGLASARTAELVDALVDFRPHVVFVDTLMRHTQGADVASNKDMGIFIGFMDELRQAFGCTIVLIHHTTKAATDFMGANHIYGAADVMMHLKPKEGEIELSTLTASSRDWDFHTVPYHLQVKAVDPDKAGWATLEVTDKAVQTGSGVVKGGKQKAVLAYLVSGPKTTREVHAELFPGQRDEAARRILNKLHEAMLVERSGSPTRWSLPKAERAEKL